MLFVWSESENKLIKKTGIAAEGTDQWFHVDETREEEQSLQVRECENIVSACRWYYK